MVNGVVQWVEVEFLGGKRQLLSMVIWKIGVTFAEKRLGKHT